MLALKAENYEKIYQLFGYLTMAKRVSSLKIDDLLVEVFEAMINYDRKYFFNTLALSFESKEEQGFYNESIFLYLETRYRICYVKGILSNDGNQIISLNLEEKKQDEQKHKEQTAYVEKLLQDFDKYLNKIK